uniref:Uncharacterized protein n=1 Tax=Rhizophora mucronata TaxID=61149 RepID=A0A2P2PAU3_RHIMU
MNRPNCPLNTYFYLMWGWHFSKVHCYYPYSPATKQS